MCRHRRDSRAGATDWRELAKRHCEANRLLGLTFFSERFGVREARAAGFDVYLRTPIDPTDVVHIVATLVNRRRPPSR